MAHQGRKLKISGSLYRLIYCSRNVIARVLPDADVAVEIQTILAASRRHNTADGMTGAMLFTASGFAQVLEGRREAVERSFERIVVDPRHADVTVLSFTPTERRSFPDWPMGFCGHRPADPDDPLAHLLADATSSGHRATTGSDVLRLLARVVQREDEWMAV